MIRLVVGLGNPGRKYAKTKHNVGWMILDRLAEDLGVSVSKDKFKGLVGELQTNDGKKVFLLKPLTYMNLSGESVGYIARFYTLKPEEILVISDDLDLPLGKVRIRLRGSSGGHKGIDSVERHLKSQNFPRLRVGIGRPERKEDVVNYVLSPFNDGEIEVIRNAVATAVNCLKAILQKGEIDNKIMSECK